jgi:YidC/Oxa1 family membrane protein insertase
MFKDKNTVIGFALLAVLFFAYFTITSIQSKKTAAAREIEQKKKDSAAIANAPKVTEAQKQKNLQDSIDGEKNKTISAAGSFSGLLTGTEQMTTVENELMSIGFSNKGGRPAKIVLKKFKNFKNQLVQLLGDSTDKFGYQITSDNGAINTSQLYFTQVSNTKNTDGGSTIVFTAKDSSGRALTHTYTTKANSYMYDCNIQLQGADKLVTNNTVTLTNNLLVAQQDNDITFERQPTSSQIPYLKDGDYDAYEATRTRDFTIDVPVKWLGFKQRFFNSTMFSKVDMKNIKVAIIKKEDSVHQLYAAQTNLNIPIQGSTANIALQFYAGPNDYKILSDIGQQTKNIVQLHSQPFGFVKWINRGVIVPVFDWIRNHVTTSIGLAIALLTLFIRLLIIPLTYSSYKSGAKMKALRPDLDKLKEKHKDDQQAYAMDQMKLFKQAGVSPLGGCLPALLQIPIFFALYALFTSYIGVRGEGFLWATDLSKYDDVIKFGFNIPLLGDHLSIFAITACITSFFISIYSMSMTPDQNNPVLKYMPYFFPIIMLFIFNNLPSALTWYYTVSNVVTLAIQFVIQNYVINPDKIKAQLEENKKKVKPKSKFQERYEQMLEAQKKAKSGGK